MQAIVAINHFAHDTEAEIDALKKAVAPLRCDVVVCKHWAKGGAGATALAHKVIESIETEKSNFKLLYKNEDSLLTKLETIAQKIYAAASLNLSDEAQAQIKMLSVEYNHLPICIAKTQYSFSSDAKLRNAPAGHVLEVKSLRLSRGAGFVVVMCGDIMTMPGLPSVPASEHIDVNAAGIISGLS